LTRKWITGHPRRHLPLADSTNAEAWRALEAGEPPGLLVTAGAQTAGRGREGRAFHSPPGGLWASLTAASRLPVAELAGAGVAVAVAAAEALRETTGLDVTLRWPNDLMAGDLKLGGVLLESRQADAGQTRLVLLVLGLGVNLTLQEKDVPPDLSGTATSVFLAGGKPVSPEALLQVILPRLDVYLQNLERGRAAPLLARWRTLCRTLGRRVTVQVEGRALTGVLREITLTEIALETGPGTLKTLAAGQVSRLSEVPSPPGVSSAARPLP
jgi:BirA family biotin operon repressor/biotin-[acetyl-CoA-carboxylase] ligase